MIREDTALYKLFWREIYSERIKDKDGKESVYGLY